MGQGKLNTHIIFKGVLSDAVYQKLVNACRNCSLPKFARFLRHSYRMPPTYCMRS